MLAHLCDFAIALVPQHLDEDVGCLLEHREGRSAGTVQPHPAGGVLGFGCHVEKPGEAVQCTSGEVAEKSMKMGNIY